MLCQRAWASDTRSEIGSAKASLVSCWMDMGKISPLKKLRSNRAQDSRWGQKRVSASFWKRSPAPLPERGEFPLRAARCVIFHQNPQEDWIFADANVGQASRLPSIDLRPQAGRPRYMAEVQKETDFGISARWIARGFCSKTQFAIRDQTSRPHAAPQFFRLRPPPLRFHHFRLRPA
jgi:hypothetical protein